MTSNSTHIAKLSSIGQLLLNAVFVAMVFSESVSRSVLFLSFSAIMVSGSSGTSDVRGLGVI